MRTAGAGVSIGDVLAGKYRVEKILGVGGMGVVVAVQHLRLEQRFAVKLMLPEMLASKEAIARFMREARASSTIKSEHVVRVFDVDSLESGAPYIVMELLEGKDVATLVRERKPMSVEDAVDVVLQVCEVVMDAHARGIVHRDLKPSNLFALRIPEDRIWIKVLDFGISKLTAPDQAGPAVDITNTAAAMGSPLYMSPEQMQSARDVDFRTDIWSIGVILHELLAGRVPFEGSTPLEVGLKITGRPPPPLRTVRPDAPSGIEDIVLKCLDKDPARRYRDIGELALALAEFAPARSRDSVERTTRRDSQAGPSAAEVPSAFGRSAKGEMSDATVTAHPLAEMATPQVHRSSTKSVSSTATSPPAWGTTMPPTSRRRMGAIVVVGAGAAAVLGAIFFAWTQEGADGSHVDTTTAASTEIQVASAAPPPFPEALVAPQPMASIENTAPPVSAESGAAQPDAVKRPKPAAKPGQIVRVAPAASASASPPATASAPLAKPSVWQERK